MKLLEVTHCIATCQDCGAEFEDYRTAREEAHRHSKSKNHFVTGEVGYSFSYGNSLTPESK